jgi:hypothetical protein
MTVYVPCLVKPLAVRLIPRIACRDPISGYEYMISPHTLNFFIIASIDKSNAL